MQLTDSSWVQALAYLGAGLSVGLGALSVALGEGYAAGSAGEALAKRPEESGSVLKNMLIGQAVAESAGIFALVVAMMLVFMDTKGAHLVQGFAYVGSGLAMGLAALGSGLGSGLPAAEACRGIADQPHLRGTLATNMLIGSALCQTPSIFGMVVAFILLFLDFQNMPLWPNWAAVLGAGLAMGLSAIGSGLGSGLPAAEAVRGITRQPEAATGLRTNMLVGSAVTQTPAIFGMVIAFMLLFIDWHGVPAWPLWANLLTAGLCIGLAAIGSGLGNGLVAGQAARGIARTPDSQKVMTPTMLIGMTVSQSPCIFGFLVALILLITPSGESHLLADVSKPIAAGLCMGIGALGPGLGEGIVAAFAVQRIAHHMALSGTITRVMLVGMAVTESTAIYALIISLVLLYVV